MSTFPRTKVEDLFFEKILSAIAQVSLNTYGYTYETMIKKHNNLFPEKKAREQMVYSYLNNTRLKGYPRLTDLENACNALGCSLFDIMSIDSEFVIKNKPPHFADVERKSKNEGNKI